MSQNLFKKLPLNLNLKSPETYTGHSFGRNVAIESREVVDDTCKKKFRDFPKNINRDNPDYISPLDKDIEAVFDQKTNKFFTHGICKRWIFMDQSGQTVGRVAAFINSEYIQQQLTGGIGFFECVNNIGTAHFIFDHCKRWLLERGMEAMDGPINFGERLNCGGYSLKAFILQFTA